MISGRRIALVIGQLHRGGAEKQLTALASGLLHDHDARPRIYCMSELDEPHGPRLREAGVPVQTFSSTGGAGRLRPVLLRRRLLTDGAELVHSWLISSTIHTAVGLTGRSRPAFLASHRVSRQQRPWLRRRIGGWALRRARQVTVNSWSGRDDLMDYYRLPGERLTVIPNGVEPGVTIPRDEARRELGLATDRPVLLGVFRLDPQKDLPTFCDVAERVLERAGGGCCLVAGDGPERGWLERRVQGSPHPERFRTLGATDRIPLLLAAADLLLLTSRFEGMPNVVMEAMSAGLPVVATDVGDLSRMVHDGHSGYLACPGDVEGLAAACRRLLADSGLATRVAEAARGAMEAEFGMARMVERHAELYQEYLDRSRSIG